jgi:hypothetical protein
MKSMFFVFACLYAVCTTVAQKPKLYTIQPGDNILEQVPKKDWYQYPQFEKGAVHFRNGVNNGYLLNYNFLFGEMFFIGEKGDTLLVVNPDEIRLIAIADDQFYYDGSRFVKLDTILGDVKLATATFFGIYSQKKIGMYGTVEAEGDNFGFTYVDPNVAKLDMVPAVTTVIGQQQSLHIGNKFNKFVPMSKKAVFASYPGKRSMLKQHLKTKRVNFSVRKDVVDLIVYMNQ